MAAAAALAMILVSASARCAEPRGEPGQARWRELKLGLTPLLVMGDLNEDGRVDQTDRRLLAQMVASRGKSVPAGVTCPAAADINSDRRIDGSDLKEVDRWLAHGRSVEAPALVHRSGLACSMSQAFIAAQLSSVNHEPVSIQFLDRQLSSANSTVAIVYGAASLKPEADGTGFVITPDSSDTGHLITVAITLPGGRKYLYSFPISSNAPAH